MLAPAHKDNPILEVNNLQTYFTTGSEVIKAVDDISFTLYKGETLGIVGESGSGKSVASLSLIRLVPGPAGNIMGGKIMFDSAELGSKDLIKLSPKEMRRVRGNEIAMIFQEPMSSLNPVYTCGNQVMEALLLHKKVSKTTAKQQTIQLFEQVRLPHPEYIFKSYPHEISGGQKQRVMIAMAMSCSPKILIADEPTTALDVTVQSGILDLMRNVRDTHDTSIIFISHDLGVIAEIADRVLVMHQGKIVEQGTIWDIFANPQHPYTKGLLACRPRIDLKLKVLPTITDFMEIDAEGAMTEKRAFSGSNGFDAKKSYKYNSVTDAILQNVQSQEEIQKRQLELMSRAPILQVRDLKTYFPVKRNFFGKPVKYIKAVDGVSFEVYPGETLGLVGESGCGKTTLGRSILRLIEPTAGEVIFEGHIVRKLSSENMRKLRKEMQIIFQDPYSSLNPRMTIGEAILEPMKVHRILQGKKQRNERVMELLETVNLNKNFINRFPHELSGGQRQRICIARTLALNPRFIICDESVSALDVSVQAQVLNLLNKLKDQFNFTYIFISHDLSIVKFISDRMLVMKNGKIIESGYPDKIFENPQQEYTRKLISAIPAGNLESIRKAQVNRKIFK